MGDPEQVANKYQRMDFDELADAPLEALGLASSDAAALNTPAALAFRDGGSVRAWHGPDGVDATWTSPARSLA